MAITTISKTAKKEPKRAPTTDAPTPAAESTQDIAAERLPILGDIVFYRVTYSDDPMTLHDGVRPGDLRPAMVVRIKHPEDEPLRVDLRIYNIGIHNGEENIASSAHDKDWGHSFGEWHFRDDPAESG